MKAGTETKTSVRGRVGKTRNQMDDGRNVGGQAPSEKRKRYFYGRDDRHRPRPGAERGKSKTRSTDRHGAANDKNSEHSINTTRKRKKRKGSSKPCGCNREQGNQSTANSGELNADGSRRAETAAPVPRVPSAPMTK